MGRSVVIGYHGHCFDGMGSAAVLTRLLREVEPGPLDISYRGLDHQPGGSHVPEAVLSGEVNCVVDFRFTASPKLDWYFDHHVSGIVGEEERRQFEADRSGHKFFDPGFGSCCKLIAQVATERFGVDLSALADLVEWADVIDAARFRDAQQAVELKEPALRLMTVIEAHGNDKFIAPRVRELSEGASLASLADAPQVKRLLEPLLEMHAKNCRAIQERGVFADGVVRFDLAGSGDDRYNKFIPYWLFPESRYCVAVTASKSRAKVSVGSNPWAPVPRSHNIAELCARYGGGGHPVVGAVSLAADQLERARQIAAEIAAELGR